MYCKITPVDITSSSSTESLQNGFIHDTTDTSDHGIGDLRENAKGLWPIMEVAVSTVSYMYSSQKRHCNKRF